MIKRERKMQDSKNSSRLKILGLLVPIVTFAAIKLVLSALDTPWLDSGRSVLYLCAEITTLLFMSVALSLNLKCGSFDFSLGAVALLTPYLSLGVFPAADLLTLFVTAVFFGCLLGLISGCTQILARLSPAFCSLCLCIIYEGLGHICSRGGQTKYALTGKTDDSLLRFFILSAVFLLVFLWFVMKKTVFGYNYRAVSCNEEIARAAGVDTEWNKLFLYIISGGLMGAVGIMLYLREGESVPADLNFSSVRVLFFGLLPLFVGRLISRTSGELSGEVIGSVCIAMIYSALAQLGLSESLRTVICGGGLLLLLIYISNEKRIFKKIHLKSPVQSRLKKS